MNTAAVVSHERSGLNLRQLLVVDGVSCLAMGVALAFAATPLAELFALPQALLFYAGLALIPCAALMFLAARQLAAPLVWLVIGGNAAWVLASVGVALWFEPTWLGLAFVVAQTAFVVVLLLLELRAHAAGR